ncbi:hypothetical protein OESDEN_03059 [Oesophagostomum dentatum]|uniref:Uncharacterized protein n=1 Tax=Oesophagostomum dentatum TaxID=61180 RepID=A0A0B1TMA8_OESDE|nr:hypothetical protein OESDEN_03059 [Oesophagostomum dentatum]
MFFYSPNARASTSTIRRPTLAHTTQLNVGHLDTRLSYQIPEILSRRATVEAQELLRHLPEELRVDEQCNLALNLRHDLHTQDLLELCASPVSSVFSTTEARRASRQKLFLRRPTISIQEDGKIVIDHVTARWEGVPLNSQSALIDADDGATVITDTIKDDAERQEPKSCPQQTVKHFAYAPEVFMKSVSSRGQRAKTGRVPALQIEKMMSNRSILCPPIIQSQ